MQNENLKFSFGNVHITIKWIPEGWLAIVNVKDANVSMDIVPDKKHIWTPRADDWQVNTVFAFHKKKAKSIRTPSGWLFYILNKESWKASHTSKSYVSTKYIHDPENVFNPDETVEKKKSEPENNPDKGFGGKTVLELIAKDNDKKPARVVENYQVRVKNFYYGGSGNSPVEAQTLDELKEILRDKYNKTSFTLISSCLSFDTSAIHNQRRNIPLDELDDYDCRWLAERTDYDVRHLE